MLRDEETANNDKELEVDDEAFTAHDAVPLNDPSYFKNSPVEEVNE
jgi:hypothetical protein